MRIARFRHGGRTSLGVLDEGTGDLAVVAVHSFEELLARPGEPADELASLAAAARQVVRPEDVEFLAPIVVPVGNVIAIGWNYLEHAREGDRPAPVQPPDRPTMFAKARSTIIGPFDDIRAHRAVTAKLDWEAELAVVIGRTGVDIPEAEARRYVLGYTVANDVSARDVQRAHGGQWYKGKSLDATCPVGPYLLLEGPDVDPAAFELTCVVNGETMQQDSTTRMIFDVPRLVAELSRGTTLGPGDLILTGTPAGVGHHREPPVFLQPDDLVETTISGIGGLRNRVSD